MTASPVPSGDFRKTSSTSKLTERSEGGQMIRGKCTFKQPLKIGFLGGKRGVLAYKLDKYLFSSSLYEWDLGIEGDQNVPQNNKNVDYFELKSTKIQKTQEKPLPLKYLKEFRKGDWPRKRAITRDNFFKNIFFFFFF